MARLAYHRVSDDSVSSWHEPDLEEACNQATRLAEDPDIDSAWVRDDSSGRPLDWQVVWFAGRDPSLPSP
jgi:hypothetical protein